MNAAVSISVAVICLTAAGLMWTVGGKHLPRICALLVLTGSAGLLNSPMGSWARRGLSWVIQEIGVLLDRVVGAGAVTGVLIGALIAAGTLYAFIVHMFKDKKADEHTLSVAAVVPLTVTAIPGPLGAAAVTVIAGVVGLIAQGVSTLFGLG